MEKYAKRNQTTPTDLRHSSENRPSRSRHRWSAGWSKLQCFLACRPRIQGFKKVHLSCYLS